jgi:hypothetical protein
MSSVKKVNEKISNETMRQVNPEGDFELKFVEMLTNFTAEQVWRLSYETTARMPVYQRLKFISAFVSSLEQSGVNVGRFFVLLGIDATNRSEITPSDFGMLLRYFYLNDKAIFLIAIKAISGHAEIVRSIIKQINVRS